MQNRRVLILGAGASRSAGYPLGAELMTAVDQYFDRTQLDERTETQWSYFHDLRDNAPEPIRLLLTSANPEVVLSYLDLCAEALQADDSAIKRLELAALHELAQMPPGDEAEQFVHEQSESFDALYKHMARTPLRTAVRARLGFIGGLDAYLRNQHWGDNEPGAGARREYLKRELKWVRAGDIVLTTNYDTLVERVLLESGRWSYVDGYGFHVPLTDIPPDTGRKRTGPPAWAVRPSKVKVLKLHGSFGWRRIEGLTDKPSDEIILSGELLDAMFQTRRGLPSLLFDLREARATFPISAPVLAYPSFLKRTPGRVFLEIWEAARIAIATASDVRVIGASLPYADSAMRTLLAPLRFRLARRVVKVSVHDGNSESYERWREHLGPGVTWRERYVG